MKRKFLFYSLIQFFLLFAFWLVLSEHYDLYHISLGFFSALAVMLFNWRFRKYFFFRDPVFRETPEQPRLKLSRLLFFYLPWLIWQIITASLQVAYVVISPKMPINPSMIRFKTKLNKVTARVILGNSITLTPGTITVDLGDEEFVVHALMDVSFSGIESDSLPYQVAKLYDKKPGQIIYDLKIMRSRGEA